MFGVLAIDKPAGMTSRGVVSRIEKIVRPARVGHTGTLDPLASGVLLMAIGPATRLVEFSHLETKSYLVDFLLGHSSSSLDLEQAVSRVPGALPLSRQQFESASRRWIGEVTQVPPKFSAVHVNGKRAYELARKGREFDVPARRVTIQAIDIEAFEYPRVTLRVHCGTGTYIRSLGSDIACELGSDAVMTRLVRTGIGSMRLADCVQLDALKSVEDVQRLLQSPRHLVSRLQTIVLEESAVSQIRNGIPIALSEALSTPAAAIDDNGELVAILTPSGTRYRSLRVFQKSNEMHQPSMSSRPHSPES